MTNSSSENIAESLVLELIRGGHFSNDKIPETKIADVQAVINKYAFILKNSPPNPSGRKKLQLFNWILEVAACEIEETISPFIKEQALIDFMFELMKERISVYEGVVSKIKISEEEKNIQTYVAVQQALSKLDRPIISYNLLKYKFPAWKTADADWLSEMTKSIYEIWGDIEKDLTHPLGKKFYAICEKYDTPYLLLGDVLSEENPSQLEEFLSHPEKLEVLIKKNYAKRLSTLKSRLSRAATYSTLSILLSNSLSLLVLEIPLAKLITGSFSPITILVDIAGPTILMYLLTETIKLPPKNNLQVVVLETMKIVYQTEKKDIYEVKAAKRRGLITRSIISLIYLLGALISFGFIFWIFELAGFPPTSVVINIVFVALIVFAGLAIRKRAQELTIEEKDDGFFGFVFDILLLPVASLGRWLSNKWKRYNAIAAFFNALIDMPFLVFVEFLERWRYFLKEKKEEIR